MATIAALSALRSTITRRLGDAIMSLGQTDLEFDREDAVLYEVCAACFASFVVRNRVKELFRIYIKAH